MLAMFVHRKYAQRSVMLHIQTSFDLVKTIYCPVVEEPKYIL